jgi:hypothetical protein
MKMTVTNITATTKGAPGFTINTPDTGLGGVSADAVGGNKLYKLPYPFSHFGPIVASGTAVAVIHTEDFRFQSVPWLPMEPSREWQMLIQQGIVSVSFSEPTLDRGLEDAEVALNTA